MIINPIAPLLISCFALVISCAGFYYQHLRKTRKAIATALWCKQEDGKFIIEGSISNQGNRPVIISKIWLLSPLNRNVRVKHECESVHQSAPLKVQPLSAEFLRLVFTPPDDIKLYGLYPTLEISVVTYDLLFYVTDDRGIEHYAQMPAIKLMQNGEGLVIVREPVQLVPGSKHS